MRFGRDAGSGESYLRATGGALTGPLAVPAGSAAAPSIRVGAEQSGLHASAGYLSLSVAGAARAYLSSAGLFGCATITASTHDFGATTQLTAPSNGKLKLRNSGDTAGVVFDATTDAVLGLRNRADTAGASLFTTSAIAVGGTASASQSYVSPTGTYLASGNVVAWSAASSVQGQTLDAGLARAAAGVLSVTNGGSGGGALGLSFRDAPGVPGAGRVTLYVRDAGGGKAELVLQAPGGAEHVLFTEP